MRSPTEHSVPRRDDPSEEDLSRLVVASNRLPFTAVEEAGTVRIRRSTGGLVTALAPALERRRGTWIGWDGGRELSPEELDALDLPHDVVPIHLPPDDVQAHYEGMSNRALWPLLHFLVDRTRFDASEWSAYERVNRRFAETIAEHLTPGSLAWVHDYHLMRAPLHLRRMRPDARVAFFLHVPFPGPDVFRLLPCDRSLLRGLLACDLVGFHVRSYARNFMDCAERLLGARCDRERGLLDFAGRQARVGAFPLGIDFRRFETLARGAPPNPSLGRERLLLGVDRLDYTKGIPERMRAFELFLERHPQWHGKVALVQLAVPSRTGVAGYGDLKCDLDELVGRLNGRFGTAAWTPVRYLFRALDPEDLAALYRDADVALVTPLRDGMNLVAKEFVACQVADPGVLVLSRFAGAAETMREAVLVNPYDADGLAEAIDRALSMERTERRERLIALRRREERRDVADWLERFLSAAKEPLPSVEPLGDRELSAWFEDFFDQHVVELMLAFDGTLTPIADDPGHVQLPEAARRALQACLERGDLGVTIVSGRRIDDVRERVGLAGVAYVGNHGLEIEGPDLEPFRHPDLALHARKTEALADSLREIARDGAWVESKGATLTFHVRQVPEELRPRMREDARRLITEAGFQARDADRAVEACPPIPWDKGRAVLRILRERHGPDWTEHVSVLYAGDDVTDEDAFSRLAGLARTLRVGRWETVTLADHRLRDPDDLVRLLDWIAARPRPGDG